MRKFIYLLTLLPFLTACNDGDVLTVDLEFEDTFETCGDLVFYKTKSDPAESLSIFLDDLTIDDIIETVDVDDNPVFQELASSTITRTLDGSTKRINYRTYTALPSTSDLFCSDVPSSSLNITNDSVGTGELTITTTLVEDDNDGIPAEFEDINGNGILDDDDTDGDGIPNYLDDDDDGDNVKTIDEFHNFDTNNDLSNALNTDLADEIANGTPILPNYLDNDDDGDGIPTRDERSVLPTEHNPATNITDQDLGIADYLNAAITESVTETLYRDHVITQTFEISIIILNLSIPQLSQDILDFGKLEDSSITTGSRNPPTIFN
ncbi:MAG: hypothetical protein ACSHXF_12055 [Aquaticitalea sp.]